MKKQIIRISPLQTAKVSAAVWLVITLPLILLMAIPMMLVPGPKPPFFSGFLLAMPFCYAIFGFLFTLFSAWVYNLLAKHIGGVEFTLKEMPEVAPLPPIDAQI